MVHTTGTTVQYVPLKFVNIASFAVYITHPIMSKQVRHRVYDIMCLLQHLLAPFYSSSQRKLFLFM